MSFAYSTYTQAPIEHKMIVGFTSAGATPEMIAQTLSMEPSYVRSILEHPPIAAALAAVNSDTALIMQKQYGTYQKLCLEVIEKSREILNDPKLDPGEVVKMMKVIFAHHPDGLFAAKKVVASAPGPAAGDNRRELLERAQELGVDAAKPVLDAEFTVVAPEQETAEPSQQESQDAW